MLTDAAFSPPMSSALAVLPPRAPPVYLRAAFGMLARDHATSEQSILDIVRHDARVGRVHRIYGDDGTPMVFDRNDADWDHTVTERDPYPCRHTGGQWRKQAGATVDLAELAAIVGAVWPRRQRPDQVPDELLRNAAAWHQCRDAGLEAYQLPMVRQGKISATTARKIMVAEIVLGRVPLAMHVDDELLPLNVAEGQTLCGVVDGMPRGLPSHHVEEMFSMDHEEGRVSLVRWEDHGRLGLRPKFARLMTDVVVHVPMAMEAIRQVVEGERQIGPVWGSTAWAGMQQLLDLRATLARGAT